MGMEVIWIRLFTPYIGPVVYSFAMVLVAYLLATFAGAQVYRWWSRRHSRESELAWIGLALLGTVAWSAVSSNLHSAHLPAAATKAQQAAVTNHALAYGFSHGYLVSAGVVALAVLISLALIRIKASDLSGVNPMAAPTD